MTHEIYDVVFVLTLLLGLLVDKEGTTLSGEKKERIQNKKVIKYGY